MKMMRKIRRIFLAYSKHIVSFLLLLCTLFYILYCLALQDAMLTLSAVHSGQCCACIWQFCIAPLELWATLLAGGSNDVERDQMQAKMHLYTHISAYIQAFNTQITMQKDATRCIYIYMFSSVICISISVYMAAYSHIYPYMHHFGAQEARKDQFIVHSQPGSWCVLHWYGAALPNFPAEGCSTNRATRTLGQQTETSSIQVTRQA